MANKVFFGKWESVCLLISMIGTKVVITYPRINVEIAGTAGWILPIYTGVIALLFFLCISKLFASFNGKDIIDVSEIAGGKPFVVFTGIVIVIFFMFIISSSLRLYSEQMKSMAFENSPISFITLLFLVGMVIAVYLGIETIVRFQAVLVPVSIAAFLIFLIGLTPYCEIDNIFPLLGNGAEKLFVSGALKVSEFSELFMLFMLFPFLQKHSDFKRVGWFSIIASTFFMTSLNLVYICVFEYPAGLTSFLPAYRMARIIDYGRFFEKTDSLLVITWSTMVFMYLSAGFYFIIYSYAKTFGLKYYRPLIVPFAIILFALSLLPSSMAEATNIIVMYFRNYSWIVAFVFPIIILVMARIRLKRSENK